MRLEELPIFMSKKFSSSQKIYIAGHRGMVGAALVRAFRAQGYENLILRTRQELDLCDAMAVRSLFDQEKPEVVELARQELTHQEIVRKIKQVH